MTFRELLERSLRVDDSFLDAEEASALLEAAVSDVMAIECPGHIFHGVREPLECGFNCVDCWGGVAFGRDG